MLHHSDQAQHFQKEINQLNQLIQQKDQYYQQMQAKTQQEFSDKIMQISEESKLQDQIKIKELNILEFKMTEYDEAINIKNEELEQYKIVVDRIQKIQAQAKEEHDKIKKERDEYKRFYQNEKPMMEAKIDGLEMKI